MTTAVADYCVTSDTEHEWESVGTTERIDITTNGVLYECLKCGKTEFQYYAIEDTELEDY
jgi:hypothetical protein